MAMSTIICLFIYSLFLCPEILNAPPSQHPVSMSCTLYILLYVNDGILVVDGGGSSEE